MTRIEQHAPALQSRGGLQEAGWRNAKRRNGLVARKVRAAAGQKLGRIRREC
jgi:hypothetical protein